MRQKYKILQCAVHDVAIFSVNIAAAEYALGRWNGWYISSQKMKSKITTYLNNSICILFHKYSIKLKLSEDICIKSCFKCEKYA